MKSFEPQFRFRKLIALSAMLPSLTVGNLTCALAESSKDLPVFAPPGKAQTAPLPADNKSTTSKPGTTNGAPGSTTPATSNPASSNSASSNSASSNSASSNSASSNSSGPASSSSTSGSTQPNWLSSPTPGAIAPKFPPPNLTDTNVPATSSPATSSPTSGSWPNTAPSTPTVSGPGPFQNTMPGSAGNPGATSANGAAGQNKFPGADSYPSVGRMERLTFGSSLSDSPIEQRLTKLETAIYQKSFGDLSLFDRTQQLKKTLLGNDDEPTADIDNLRVPANGWPGSPTLGFPSMLTDQGSSEFDYWGGIAQRPENQQTTTLADMKDFALELINSERSKSGLGPLAIDPLADKLAQEQNDELCKRNVISHANSKGENPDRRYTVGGGTGALTESLVSNKTTDMFSKTPTRAAVAELMKTLMSRQDDRDAILNQDATNIGLSINFTPSKDRIIAVTEVVTNHGIIPELPKEVGIGEKLEIKGVVMQPYQFDRITLAWEANKGLASAPDESEEALPYFPPLDYVAYAGKSAHDYSGAVSALRTAGVIAAIAGGIFMPPVALAAPLIAMSGGVGGNGDPKPVSDIPIHGGVKVEGLTFNGKVPINKDGKEGIYYITIWGTLSKLGKSVPISRRAIIAKHVDEDVSAKLEPSTDAATDSTGGTDDKEQKKKEKHHHHKNK